MGNELTELEYYTAIMMADPSSKLSYDSTERTIDEDEVGFAYPLASDLHHDPETICLREQLFGRLSAEAKLVATIILECPKDFVEHITSKQGEISRCMVREKLPLILWRGGKGNKRLIMKSVCEEIAACLKEMGID